jgi:hypothetical protein
MLIMQRLRKEYKEAPSILASWYPERSDILRWVKKLESGQLKQGRASLCSERDGEKAEWCCLGVYGDLVVDSWWIKEGYCWFLEGNHGFLSTEVMPEDVQSLFAAMNDSGLWSFHEIAAVIRHFYLY